MKRYPALPFLAFLLSPLLLFTGAAGASGPGDLVPAAIAHLSVAITVVLVALLGLFAYASLARLAPYHAWIYLYLISLAGVAWALFRLIIDTHLPEATFIITTVAGVNLFVHAFRFDRIEMSLPGRWRPREIRSD